MEAGRAIRLFKPFKTSKIIATAGDVEALSLLLLAGAPIGLLANATTGASKIILTKLSGYDKNEAMLTEGRKWFVVKSILNLLPIVAAAAFATEFFSKFNISLRIVLAVGFVSLIVVGFLIAPE